MSMAKRQRKDRVSEQILWLKDRVKEWHAPVVVYEETQFGTGYEPLGCSQMNVDVDFYWSTAVTQIHGEWKNNLPDQVLICLICNINLINTL